MSETVEAKQIKPDDNSKISVISFSRLEAVAESRPRDSLTKEEMGKLKDIAKCTPKKRYAQAFVTKKIKIMASMEDIVSGKGASAKLGDFMDPYEEFPIILGKEREDIANEFDSNLCVVTSAKIGNLVYVSECDVELRCSSHANYVKHLQEIGVDRDDDVKMFDKCGSDPAFLLMPNTRQRESTLGVMLSNNDERGVMRMPTVYMHGDMLDHMACANPTKESIMEGTVSRVEPTYGGRFMYFTSNHAIAFFFRTFYPVLRSRLDISMLDGEDIRGISYKDVVFRGNYSYIMAAMDTCVKRISSKIPYENIRETTLTVNVPNPKKWTKVDGSSLNMPSFPVVYMDDNCNIVFPNSTFSMSVEITMEYVMFRKASDQAMKLMLGRPIDIFSGQASANCIDQESLEKIFMEIEKPSIKKIRTDRQEKPRPELTEEATAKLKLTQHPWVVFDTTRFF